VAKHIGTDRLLTVEAAADRKGDAERALVLIEAQIVADGAALIFQHQARGADQAITSAIDGQIVARRRTADGGTAGAFVPTG